MTNLISGKEDLVYGHGINDFDGSISVKGKHIYEYKIWKAMLRRCYSEGLKIKRPTYKNCVVDSELLSFDNFYNFIRDVHGFSCTDSNGRNFHLDKDLLGCGSLYSRDTICFVPSEINAFLTNKKAVDSGYPIGVLFHKASGRLVSQITINGKKKYLGLFDNSLDAFNTYKREKENQAKHLAEKYKQVTDDRIYKALIYYKVDMND